ncbi:ABC transporter permease [Trueperella bialowiezensis]|uniref:ABC-type transport system involved in multi-copper enzyme maturation, permease component n=1 Tax=Trueperella bialowiezensis TaxID=312285 RepID=A0A448PDM3_9ACTO|nr:ABC transporter permease [Trueperella bialowiezensis]VEI13029.1 ABC-type transport system involved in multi-copper enzyme maturation, permease component [Trueperella bialowiezensis]
MIIQIIRRELAMLLRNRAMIISTVVVVALILIAGVAGRIFLGGDDDAEDTPVAPAPAVIAVEAQMADYAEHLEGASGGLADVQMIDEGTGESFLEANAQAEDTGPAAVLAGIPGDPLVLMGSDGAGGPDQRLQNIVNAAATAWYTESLGHDLSADQLDALQAHVSVQVQLVTIGSANLIMTNPIGYFSSLIGLFLMFMMIIMGITTIANGVVEEKSSRVVEILLTTIKPRTMLLGKVLGIGIFIIGQFALFVLAAFVALEIADVFIPLDVSSLLGWMLVWLVLGFFFYAMLTGALASTASRQEDLAAVTTPISLVLLVPFYAALFLVPSAPDSTLTKVLSQIPGFGPFLMPARQAYETVTTPELILSAVLSTLAIPAVAVVAGKIYENSILHTGRKLKVLDALRGGRN